MINFIISVIAGFLIGVSVTGIVIIIFKIKRYDIKNND